MKNCIFLTGCCGARCLPCPPLCCAFAPPILLEERIGIPPPPCSAAAAPAASVSVAAVWLRVPLGLHPLPLRSVLRSWRGAAAARCWSVSGLLRRRCPVLRRALAGAGVSCLGSLTLATRLFLGADYAPSGLVLLAGCACSPALSGREKRALGAICRGLPLRPAAVWAQAVPRLSSRCCPARCRWQPLRGMQLCCMCLYHAAPLRKHIKTAAKSIKKRQKARFLCGISPQASRSASTDSTLKSPVSGAFWAAVDAAQSKKRYLKPPTWWGAAPFRAGGKAQLPRSQSCCRV